MLKFFRNSVAKSLVDCFALWLIWCLHDLHITLVTEITTCPLLHPPPKKKKIYVKPKNVFFFITLRRSKVELIREATKKSSSHDRAIKG